MIGFADTRTYVDARGIKYRVMGDIGGDCCKARYQVLGKGEWKCLKTLPWRDHFADAQADLARLAGKEGWEML